MLVGGGLPFLLPARGPLTSPLLLLANCDAADTLVMFSASFVRPLPAPQPAPPAARTIFGIAGGGPVKRETRRRIYFASGILLLLLFPSSTMEFEGSRRSHPLPPPLERGDDFDSKFNWILFFFFFLELRSQKRFSFIDNNFNVLRA